jgi:hypothetical protein
MEAGPQQQRWYRNRWKLDLRRSAGNSNRWKLNLRSSAGNRNRWKLDLNSSAGSRNRWKLDLRRSAGNRYRWKLDLRRSVGNRYRWKLNLRSRAGSRNRWKLDLRRSAGNCYRWKLDLRRSAGNSNRWKLNLKSSAGGCNRRSSYLVVSDSLLKCFSISGGHSALIHLITPLDTKIFELFVLNLFKESGINFPGNQHFPGTGICICLTEDMRPMKLFETIAGRKHNINIVISYSLSNKGSKDSRIDLPT